MLGYEILFCLMLILFHAILIYPWHPSWPGARFLVHLPLLLPICWLVYEQLMPRQMNIRLDIPIIMLAIMLAYTVYAARLILFAVLRNRKGKSAGEPNQK